MKETSATPRCAIYTRKSSEEGLEQTFNSLHAQREACEAYVLSQKHEGWILIKDEYDDGGFSGGNMERPGLKRLLADINIGKIDTVVVYKVDRLTRSLSDFARIVELFDSKGISFVSVTQQFNTTTSMGRLTLNVLLSFAQFEREITGERIRDKFAASKRKGIWMGGLVALGYDFKDRRLLINEEEAAQVREIFKQYLRLGAVSKLYAYLKKTSIRSKRRVRLGGERYGGEIMSRGTIYHLLGNPLYIGKIKHKNELHDGQHDAIIDLDTWRKTAEMLKSNAVVRRTSHNIPSGRLLTGLLFNADGKRFIPTHTSKKGRRYDYYACQEGTKDVMRLPAREVERLALSTISSMLGNPFELSRHFPDLAVRETKQLITAAQSKTEVIADSGSRSARAFLRAYVQRMTVAASKVTIELNRLALRKELLGRDQKEVAATNTEEAVSLSASLTIKRRGSEVRLVLANGPPMDAEPIPSLVRAVARARDLAEQIIAGKACTVVDLVQRSGVEKRYVQIIMKCAALSPEMIEAILKGAQPVDMTVVALVNGLALDWKSQSFK